MGGQNDEWVIQKTDEKDNGKYELSVLLIMKEKTIQNQTEKFQEQKIVFNIM
jgi:hypothetical protein